MLDNEPTGVTTGDAEGTAEERSTTGVSSAPEHRAASRPAGPPPEADEEPTVLPGAPATISAPDASPAVATPAPAAHEVTSGAADDADDKPAPRRRATTRTRRATRPAAPAPEVPDEPTGSATLFAGARPSATAEALAPSAADQDIPAADRTGVHRAGPGADDPVAEQPAPRRRTTRARRATRPAASAPEVPDDAPAGAGSPADPDTAATADSSAGDEPAQPKRRRSRAKAADTAPEAGENETGGNETGLGGTGEGEAQGGNETAVPPAPAAPYAAAAGPSTPSFLAPVMFRAPEPAAAPPRERATADDQDTDDRAVNGADYDDEDDGDEDRGNGRRRRRRGGRGRTKKAGDAESAQDDAPSEGKSDDAKDGDGRNGKNGRAAKNGRADDDAKNDRKSPAKGDDESKGGKKGKGGQDSAQDGESEGDSDQDGTSRRRRRRRRRAGSADSEGGASAPDDPENTVVKIRPPRESKPEDEVQSLRGSTRLEAKKQRRREGREQGRRRPPIITESEFLARRESVERVMAVRRVGERTQIGVLEDGVLVEHYVDRSTQQSYVGNVYLGKVQNVLPSMEAAFVDIGKGRNAVLYAGEVNFDATGMEGQPKRIESALKSGQSVLVQVTKDPIGHKGARLTSQVSLPGRYLVYVPEGSMTGISRKLPDSERSRLKQILKKVMPEDAGVIVRTAAEGASEEELAGDIERLAAQWEQIKKKAKTAQAPSLLHGEPDMTVRVVRDIFNEDFKELIVSGEAWETVDEYVNWVAPNLAGRLNRWTGERDLFEAHRIDEQIAKALERKVWLPSGGSLVIDRTEAMTVIDVNTGKFTGQGGNLEETVTKNNLEAAEEIVRQLRLRDIGGIIVIDFIDMVLEANRDLVLRRLLECLARDRTKHQVAEVTSLGLVQMTRKRVGQGLLEAFSETCEHCNGRGIVIHTEPVEAKPPRGVVPAEKSRKRRKGKPEEPAEPPAADQSSPEPGPDDDESPVDAVADAAEAVTDIAAERAGASVDPVTGSTGTVNDIADKPKRRRGRRTKTDKTDNAENAEGDKTESAAVGE